MRKKIFGEAQLLLADFVVAALSLVEMHFLEAAVKIHLLQTHFRPVLTTFCPSDNYCSRGW